LIFRAEGWFGPDLGWLREEHHIAWRNLTERSPIREDLRIRTAGGDSVTNLKEPIEAIQYL
jgi:hypothetical protein